MSQSTLNERTAKLDHYLQNQMRKTGNQVRLIDLFTCCMKLFAGMLGALFLLAIIDGWLFELNGWARWTSLILLLLGGAAYFVLAIFPLLIRKVNPVYAAKVVESAQPDMKNSLINYLLLRQQTGKVSRRVVEIVGSKAANDISGVPVENTVDKSHTIKAALILTGLVILLGAYKVFSPKDPFQTFARILAPASDISKPASVSIADVTPGSAEVFFGQDVQVSAYIKGSFDPDSARVVFSTLDGQIVDGSIRMENQSGSTYRCTLKTGERGIEHSVRYKVVAGDGVSNEYELKMTSSPILTVESLSYQPAEYMELSDYESRGDTTIEHYEGTTVTINAVANADIKTSYIQLLREEQGNYIPVRKVSMERLDDRHASGKFQLQLNNNRDGQRYTHYQLHLVTNDGGRSRSDAANRIIVKPDMAPTIYIDDPQETELEVPANSRIRFELEADDIDFKIGGVVVAVDTEVRRLVKDQPLDLGDQNLAQPVKASYEFWPEKLNMRPGDLAFIQFAAFDNREPQTNTTLSNQFTIKIIEPVENPPKEGQDGDKTDGEKGGGDSKGEGDSNETGGSEKAGKGGEAGSGKEGNSSGQAEDSGKKSGDSQEGGAEGNSSESSEASQGGSGGNQSDDQQSGESSESSGNDSAEGNNASENEQNSDGTGQESGQPGNQGASSEQSDQSGNSSGTESGEPSSENSGAASGSESGNSGATSTGQQQPAGDQAGQDEDQRLPDDAHASEIFEEVMKHREDEQKEQGEGGEQDENESGSQDQPGDQGQAGNQQPGNPNQQDPGGGQQSDNQNDPAQQGSASRDSANQGSPEENEGNSSQSGNQQSGNEADGGENSQGGSQSDAGNQGGEQNDQGEPSGSESDPQSGDSPQTDDNGLDQRGDSDASSNNEGRSEEENGSSGQSEEGDQGQGDQSEQGSQSQPGEQSSQDQEQQQSGGGGQEQSQDDEQKQSSGGGGDDQSEQKSGGQSGSDEGQQPGGEKGDQPGDQQPGENGRPGDSGQGESSKGDQGQSDPNQQGSQQQNQSGDNPSNGNSEQEGSNSGNQSTGQQPGGNQSGSSESKSGDQKQKGQGEQGGGGDQSNQPDGQMSQEDQAGGNSPGNGASSASSNSPQRDRGGDQKDDAATEADKANLEYTKKATDMALEYLEDQVVEPDPKLLDRLNFTEEELADFVKRWKDLKKQAETGGEQERLDYERALESLQGLGRTDPNAREFQGKADNKQGYREDGRVNAPPPGFADRMKAYSRKRNRVRDDRDK